MRNVIATLILVLLFTAGCRMNPLAEREIALLRAEILDLEDQYYSLKSRCETGSAVGVGRPVRFDQGNNLPVGQGIAVNQGFPVNQGFVGNQGFVDNQGFVGNQGFAEPYCENCAPNTYSNPIIYQNSPEFIQNSSPEIVPFNDSGFETLPNSEPVLDQEEGSDSKLESLPSAEESGEEQSFLPNAPGQNSILRPASAQNSVSSIIINRNLSKGQDVDGYPGHEGLALLIQPITAMGEVRKVAGHLTVRVVESGGPQVERQIGLWQFTPEETTNFFVKDEFDEQGILLHLPWDTIIPTSEQLNVFVRYMTQDQRGIDASIQLPIEPPAPDYSPEDPLVAGWIERDSRWVDIMPTVNSVLIQRHQPVRTERIPEFRIKSAPSERRTSTPQWRPVR